MFLISGGLKQKGLINDLPNLDDLQDGDLKYSIDFKSVYATVLNKWLGADDEKILGRKYYLSQFHLKRFASRSKSKPWHQFCEFLLVFITQGTMLIKRTIIFALLSAFPFFSYSQVQVGNTLIDTVTLKNYLFIPWDLSWVRIISSGTVNEWEK